MLRELEGQVLCPSRRLKSLSSEAETSEEARRTLVEYVAPQSDVRTKLEGFSGA
jgi:hypothetical protein